MTGRIICIDCGEVMGEKEGIDEDTSGMCDTCFEKVKEAVRRAKAEKELI